MLRLEAELLRSAPPDLEARLEAEEAAEYRLLEADEAAEVAAAEADEADALKLAIRGYTKLTLHWWRERRQRK